MTTDDRAIPTAIPDLTDLPADRLPEAGPVLAEAIRIYRERLAASGEPLSSFNARI
jgi:hypothetical protein